MLLQFATQGVGFRPSQAQVSCYWFAAQIINILTETAVFQLIQLSEL
jgi:hypothetical protein